MEIKDKIRMLADLNDALEDQTITEALMKNSSGPTLVEIFKSSVESEIRRLLNEQSSDDNELNEVTSMASKLAKELDQIAQSPVIGILQHIAHKFETTTPQTPTSSHVPPQQEVPARPPQHQATPLHNLNRRNGVAGLF
jgi:hypothetical protein